MTAGEERPAANGRESLFARLLRLRRECQKHGIDGVLRAVQSYFYTAIPGGDPPYTRADMRRDTMRPKR